MRTLAQLFDNNRAWAAEVTRHDPEFFKRWQNLFLGLSPPQGILALECSDRQNGLGPADALYACFGESEVPHFTLLNQVLHRAGDAFNSHIRIDTVLIEEIDQVGSQTLQRGIGNLQGAVLGGLIIGIIQQLSDSRISASWTPAIVFVYLVLIMVVKPRGLLGEETREAG